MNKVVATLAIVSCALITACTPAPITVEQYATPNSNSVTVSTSGGTVSVSLVRLEGGTRCAVMIGSNRGGIDCDWQGSSN